MSKLVLEESRNCDDSATIGNEAEPAYLQERAVGNYGYEPLNSSECLIRVFTLYPCNHDDDPIEGELEVVPLSKAPPYETLSYVWGNQDRSCSVSVNDCQLEVTPNLQEALYYLRQRETKLVSHHAISEEPLYDDLDEHSKQEVTGLRALWIDAICIDQYNVNERSHQVRQMRNIYASAIRVLIWLGPGNSNLTHAMDCLNNKTFQSGISKNECERESVALKDLFTRPWWSRIWTLQELLAAQQEPLVGCGRHWISWKAFDFGLVLIGLRRGFFRKWGNIFSDKRKLGLIPLDEPDRQALSQLHSVYSNNKSGKQPSFLEVLLATNTRGASDPRDRVFALVGLMKDSVIDFTRPDYSLNVSDVYERATLSLFISGHALEPLASTPRKTKNLPTWCIDFSNKSSFDPEQWRSHFIGYFDSNEDANKLHPATAASASTPLNTVKHATKSGKLVLEGCIVGEVTKVTSLGSGSLHSCSPESILTGRGERL